MSSNASQRFTTPGCGLWVRAIISTFTAHQVIKEVTDDQFAHLVVVAGSIDLHSINKTAVAAEYRDICVKGFCQLIGNLVWVSAY